MKRRGVAGAVLVTILVLLGGLAWQLGLFAPVPVEEVEEGPFLLVHRSLPEPSAADVRGTTKELARLLDELGLPARRPAQLDPRLGSQPTQPTQIGFLVEADRDALEAALAGRASLRELPRARFLRAAFPYQNLLSPLARPWRVGPALRRHRETHGYLPATVELVIQDGPTLITLQPFARDPSRVAPARGTE